MIELGQMFGDLVVTGFVSGTKTVAALALCDCRCGGRRRVRLSRLRLGAVTTCAKCSAKNAHAKHPRGLPVAERELRNKEGAYRSNSARKGLTWSLSRSDFRAIVSAPCTYCGIAPSGGVDRVDSSSGYVRENTAPCCSVCNYAKRDLTERVFREWIARISLHNRPIK